MHGEQGWSIGPSLKHYRCVRWFFPKTRSKRDVNTITFFHKAIKFPEIHLDDFLKQAATDIITILTSPPSTTTPSLQAGDTTRNALPDIAKLLHRADDLPQHIIQPTPTTITHVVPPSPRVQPSLPVIPSPRVLPPSPRVQLPPELLAVKHPPLSINTKEKSKPSSPPLPAIATNWQKRFLRPTQGRMKRSGHERYRGLAADYLYAQHIFSQCISPIFLANHIFDENGKKQTLDNLLKGNHGKTRWAPALSNEWGRLAQGNDLGVESTDTIDFISFDQVPQNKKVTYASFACDHRPLKDEE